MIFDILTLPYTVKNIEYYADYYDEIVIPDAIGGAHPKAAITLRNRWMAEICDLVICYIEREEGWAHVVGEVKPFAVITEGPLKADVIHTLTGLTVISVPGVNTLSHLKATLEEMKSRGLCEIKTAFDMDMLTNHNVRNGFVGLMELLNEMDFKFGTYVWDARFKGLDDYIWACKKISGAP